MKSRALRLAFAIGLALAPRAFAGNTFEAVLVGSNEVPGPGVSEGSFDAVVVLEGTKVTLILTPKGIRGWMSAHIHKGAAGVDGKLVAEFPWESGDSSPRRYVGSVSERVASDMVANPEKYYVHVHLPNFPVGGARGQLAAGTHPELTANRPYGVASATMIGLDPGEVPPPGSSPLVPPLGMWAQAAGPRPVPPGVGISRPLPSPGVFPPEGVGLPELPSPDPFGAMPGAPQAPQPSPKDQSIDFRPVSSRVYRDSDFRLDASASSGLRVYFTGSGDCTVAGSTVHILSAGKCWVTAHQPGDARFSAAPNVEQLIPIAKASQRITGAPPETKTYLDPDFPLDMSATSGLSVVFFAWGDCTVSGSYIHITGAGSCSLTAHQPGDSNYLAARIVDGQFPIAKADQTIDFPELPISFSGPFDLPLNASASSGLPVVYSTYGPCAMVGPSALRMLDSGECSVTADQPGDRNFNPAPSMKRTFLIYVPPIPN